jgi:membrane protein YdbS with pleckstrin-like domain
MSHPQASARDHPQEKDLWWGSYAARTMLPSALVCLAVTAAVAGLGWYLYAYRDWPGDDLRYCVYALTAAVWLFQGVRWAYRVLFFNYRLTTHRLVVSPSQFFPPREYIPISGIAHVRAEQSGIERLLGVGRVRVGLRREGANLVVLTGVLEPDEVARLIERAMRGGEQPTQ